MTFWNVFFAVLSGIIAGVVINLALVAIMNYSLRGKAIANLKFEIDFNIERIDSFLDELGTYRNFIFSDNIQNYAGYFMISQVLTTTLLHMFGDRSIYKYMDSNHIAKLQSFHKLCSLEIERIMNEQVTRAKQNISEKEIKKQVLGQIEVWNNAFKNTKADLQAVKYRFDLSRKERRKERKRRKKN